MPRKVKLSIFFLLVFFVSLGFLWAYITNEPASLVVGQTSFISGTTGTGSSGLMGAFGVSGDSTHLYAADTNGSRVMIYNPIPNSNGVTASFAMGQSVFGIIAPN